MANKDPEKNRAYMREYMQRRWKARRAAAIAFLGKRCRKCGVSYPLEFDHIDPKTKKHVISKFTSLNEVAFWEEIRKCQLLCTDCHQKKSLPEIRKAALEREARKRALSSTGRAADS